MPGAIPTFVRRGRVFWQLVAATLFGLAGKTYAAPPERPMLPADPTLTTLIRESLTAVPELSGAQGLVRAERERSSQALSWPDPMLQVGIQNMGFTSIEIGRDPMSYVSLMASQEVPWPGKLDLRKQVAQLSTSQAETGVTRVRLTVEAEVRRQYLELLLARDRLDLLGQLELVWERTLGAARVRYESGAGAQSDLLRAQLEASRLKQRRIILVAEESTRIAALNRWRGHALDETIDTTTHVRELQEPRALAKLFDIPIPVGQSPELAAAKLGVEQAAREVALAERSYYPDLNVGAGLMVRGAMPPMWTVSVGGPFPIFAESKQSRAVSENRERVVVSRSQVRAAEQILRLRSEERRAVFRAVVQTIDLYEQGLLVQSRATMESTVNQYQAGSVTFAAVLEANAGYIADEEGYLQALASAHRILIAEAELSLAPVALPTMTANAGAMGASSSVPSPTIGSSPTSSSGM